MKKRLIIIFPLVSVFSWGCLGQAKKPPAKSKKQKIQYTWNNKPVTYKQYRDSLRVLYFKFCDSLQKAEDTKRIPKEENNQKE